MKLRDKALAVPAEMTKCIRLDADEAKELYRLLYKFLDNNCNCDEKKEL